MSEEWISQNKPGGFRFVQPWVPLSSGILCLQVGKHAAAL